MVPGTRLRVKSLVPGIRLWWLALVARGLATVLTGLAALAAFAWPGITQAGLVLLFGAYALARGNLSLVHALGSEPDYRWLFVVEGLIGIGISAAAFVWPDATGQVLFYVIAGWAIAIGLIQIASTLWGRNAVKSDWLLMLGGVIWVILGGILVFAPAVGTQVAVSVLGIYALVFGALDLALGLRLRSVTRRWKSGE
jgi:uncharacterized membrane protein HdeD (DUF308 family)